MVLKFISSTMVLMTITLSPMVSQAIPESSWLTQNANNSEYLYPLEDNDSVRESTVSINSQPTLTKNIYFSCDTDGSVPTTIANMIEDGQKLKMPLINWLHSYFPEQNQAQQMCQHFAHRLQTYYNDGQLSNMVLTSDIVEEKAVVCLKESGDSDCQPDRVIFTLSPTEEQEDVLYQMISEEIKPPRLQGKIRGDFRTRLPFRWLPF